MKDLTMQRTIAAPPATVFAFLVDEEKMLEWIGVDAALDPTAGGTLRIDVTGGDVVEGEFLEITPYERVRFTWGWADNIDVPPGATTETFDLVPVDGGTRLTLTHADLPLGHGNEHAKGWTYFLGRLQIVSRGDAPGAVVLTELNTTEPVLIQEEMT